MTGHPSHPFTYKAALGALILSAGCGATVEVKSHRGTPGSVGASAGSGGQSDGGKGGTTGNTNTSGAPGVGNTTGFGGKSGSAGSVGVSGFTGSGGSTGSAGAPTGSSGAPSLPPPLIMLPHTYDFNDGTSTGWIAYPDVAGGTSWTVIPDPKNAANMVYAKQTNTADVIQTVGGDSNWTDVLVQTKVDIVSLTDGCRIYLAARWQAEKTFYFVYLQADGSVKFGRRTDGNTLYLGTTYKTNIPVVAGASYTIGLAVKGNVVSATLNGVPAGTATDTTVPALTHGGISLGVQECVANFDDVAVTLPP
jgi:hypothetical protein